MSKPVSNVEIEDVLASIRRLVADDGRRPGAPAGASTGAVNAVQEPALEAAPERATLPAGGEAPARPDRLILTPAQRVPEAAESAASPEAAEEAGPILLTDPAPELAEAPEVDLSADLEDAVEEEEALEAEVAPEADAEELSEVAPVEQPSENFEAETKAAREAGRAQAEPDAPQASETAEDATAPREESPADLDADALTRVVQDELAALLAAHSSSAAEPQEAREADTEAAEPAATFRPDPALGAARTGAAARSAAEMLRALSPAEDPATESEADPSPSTMPGQRRAAPEVSETPAAGRPTEAPSAAEAEEMARFDRPRPTGLSLEEKIAELETMIGGKAQGWGEGASTETAPETAPEEAAPAASVGPEAAVQGVPAEPLEWEDSPYGSALFQSRRAGKLARMAEDLGSDLPEEPAPQALPAMDEAALRELVAEVIRKELQGVLGERITRNVRKLVRREIQRTLASQDFE
ncbi:hypothetical protein LR948_17720 [Roseivivax sp. GX 12232]|uniref:hypothetical protein n=1 Tax=Roseivivax sp. GX 12232 TaxID=2900547 RepID=UPI001E4E42D0|nr:hypothetical protein [Roseivivax sp. GX 12232]MCE0507210.1 hypothetical protein [Roseivivax sp. GX 12232]